MRCSPCSPLDSLWEHLEEPEINAQELEEVFSKVPLKQKALSKQKSKATKSKEVLRGVATLVAELCATLFS